MSRYGFTGPFSTGPRMKWSVFTFFGRVMNSYEEFCSDWLFHCGLIVFKDSCVPLHKTIGSSVWQPTSLVPKGCGALKRVI